MKLRILSLTMVTMILLASIMMTSLAEKPVIREITTVVLDGPYPEDKPEFYAKGVLHGVLVGVVQDDVLRAKVNMIQKINIYHLVDGDEAGDFVAILNMELQYSGTVEPNDGLVMITGTYSGTWVIVLLEDVELPIPEEATLKGHITRIYRDGEVVKEILIGVPPFELP